MSLSQASAFELAKFASELPLSAEKKALLLWFKEQPEVPDDYDSKRPNSADGWAIGLLKLIERAAAYAKKTGGFSTGKKNGAAAVPASAPEGAREWYEKNYAAMQPWPGSWWGVAESVRSEFELERSKR